VVTTFGPPAAQDVNESDLECYRTGARATAAATRRSTPRRQTVLWATARRATGVAELARAARIHWIGGILTPQLRQVLSPVRRAHGFFHNQSCNIIAPAQWAAQ
jgi:hypothetical protein